MALGAVEKYSSTTNPQVFARTLFEHGATNHTHDIGIVRGDLSDPNGDNYESNTLVHSIFEKADLLDKFNARVMYENAETAVEAISSPYIDGPQIRAKLRLLKVAKDLLPIFLWATTDRNELTSHQANEILDGDYVIFSSDRNPAARYEMSRYKTGELVAGWLINYVRFTLKDSPYDNANLIKVDSGLSIIESAKNDPHNTVDTLAFMKGEETFWQRNMFISIFNSYHFGSNDDPEKLAQKSGLTLTFIDHVKTGSKESGSGKYYLLSLPNTSYDSFLQVVRYYFDHDYFFHIFGEDETPETLNDARNNGRFRSVTRAISDNKLIIPKRY
ncbi:MAG TPA: hypothetical protein VMR81_01025 [Patescibacteria group bacterium]|nr:hypothetical protein [Patescibacteria group bacterium]